MDADVPHLDICTFLVSGCALVQEDRRLCEGPMSAIERTVGTIMSQSSVVTVRLDSQYERVVRTPAQSQIQLSPRVDPKRYKHDC